MADGDADDGIPNEVLACPSTLTPRNGVPCILQRFKYLNSAPADLRGDFEWLIVNDRNGSYRLP